MDALTGEIIIACEVVGYRGVEKISTTGGSLKFATGVEVCLSTESGSIGKFPLETSGASSVGCMQGSIGTSLLHFALFCFFHVICPGLLTAAFLTLLLSLDYLSYQFLFLVKALQTCLE